MMNENYTILNAIETLRTGSNEQRLRDAFRFYDALNDTDKANLIAEWIGSDLAFSTEATHRNLENSGRKRESKILELLTAPKGSIGYEKTRALL